MYISTAGCIIIGDTVTGNQDSGERYFLYTKREAERAYRQKHGLQGVKFQKVKVDPTWFGYLDVRHETSKDFDRVTAIVKVTGSYTTKMGDATIWHIKFEPEQEIGLTICDEKNVASLWACNWKGADIETLTGRRCKLTMVRNMAWHLDVKNIEML